MHLFEREPSSEQRSAWIDAARRCEWLEADGRGGYASGTVSGVRSRRYHALLLTATTPPARRFVLVNGFDASITTSAGNFPISAHLYDPGVVHPDGARRLHGFTTEPWPTWRFRLEDGTVVVQEIFVPRGSPAAVVRWRHLGAPRSDLRLSVRPFFSGRDHHALHRENGAFRFGAEVGSGSWIFHPYDGVPPVRSLANGSYDSSPEWYRNFRYEEERLRGLDFLEDLASPGLFTWSLGVEDAFWILEAADGEGSFPFQGDEDAPSLAGRLAAREAERRARFASPLHRAADAYLVDRGGGGTIIAGYPWFTDWGRDTFLAMRGLCLAAGRIDEGRAILVEWARALSEGMVPNRFPDGPEPVAYNAVDASLWFLVALSEYRREARTGGGLPGEDDRRLDAAVEAILDRYATGARHGIRADEDGLLMAGEPGVAVTWMDARIEGRPVTPRIGKPVEVQALWINALATGRAPRWAELRGRALASFHGRFWNEGTGCLYDVVDPDHRQGEAEPTFRPNPTLAVAGLPLALVTGEKARRIVDAVEARLLTGLGLRSLAPDEPGYAGRYEGGPVQRDGVYHQGTVWPWLIGPFVEAWLRVREDTASARREAEERFLAPVLRHLEDAGLGHVSEIADGDPPHRPRGCPFQA